MKKLLSGLILTLSVIGLVSNGYTASDKEVDQELIYQTSRLDALSAGRYDGKVTLREVKKHGNFGLGAFDKLDGEMILLDGTFYQIKGDGSIIVSSESAKTPFATVTFFEADKKASTDQGFNFQQLNAFLDSLLLNKQAFYAIKIDGTFKSVKTRSIPAQKKPYRPLADVGQDQKIFDLRDVKGTLVGFWAPESASGVNFPGYHFHFITEDKKSGGHVLELQSSSISVTLDETMQNNLTQPKGGSPKGH
ncbi:MAG: acetolactate decarboxylase [Deltaproteobacteria bacterium]|nr:acetolactate decarboxylase [Deltaproteobacteria bacterium]